jgi:hypothetical protein
MVDSQRAIIKEDGGSDAIAILECVRCDKRVYVYAENGELPITIGDLPCFCRWCGKAFEVWAIEYIRPWEMPVKTSNDVPNEEE